MYSFKKIIRTLLKTLSVYLNLSAILVIVNGAGKGYTLDLVALASIFFVPSIIITALISSSKQFKTREECVAEFKDVKHIDKKKIVFLSIIQLVCLMNVIILNYQTGTWYESEFPKAVESLKENYSASDRTVLIIEALPKSIATEMFRTAEVVGVYFDLYEDDSLNSIEFGDKVMEIEDTYKTDHMQNVLYAVISLLPALAYGYIADTIKRCQLYHTTLRKLESAE